MEFELALQRAEVRSVWVCDSCNDAKNRLAHLSHCAQILLKKVKRLIGE